MKINNPILFVEINESNYIFAVGLYNEDQQIEVIEKIITPIEGISKNKFTNINEASRKIKQKVEILESKLNYIFKDVILTIDIFDYWSSNISGYKKLNGSQLLKENISYILNSLKLAIIESENQKTILHIFNSKSILDNTNTENLPIGLYGDFYNHELTFFLIGNNDLKNINHIFNKSNLEVKKVLLKSFSEGTQLIKKNNIETFFTIKINENTSKITFFDQASFKYSENFNFGSNIIIKDVEKICSISNETIVNFLSNEINLNKNYTDQDLLEEKYFIEENYRKIRKKLIFDIANARINEITDLILNKNVNIKSFKTNNPVIYLIIQNKIISNNFKTSFKNFFSKNKNPNVSLIEDFDLESSIINSASLSLFGWKKEAIPVTQTKNSLITRIFKSIFG
jgi:cell division protein FtsA